MKLLKALKPHIAAFLTGVYIFVALIAVNLHNHSSGLEFKDFHFKKTENSVTKAEKIQEFSDCLSCHLFHDGKSILPEKFRISVFLPILFEQQLIQYRTQFVSVTVNSTLLRGPPKT